MNNKNTRRDFLKVSGAGAASLILGAPLLVQAQAKGTKPNVLLILVDDLGYGDLSSYGATDLYTPHIDALMGAGMRFNNFYANCPVCSPTRASVLTGCYPDKVGVPGVIRTHRDNSWGKLSDEATFLPTVLKGAGYNTAIVGKWHLGMEAPDRPNDRGFDYFKGYLGDMMDDYYTHRRHDINYMRHNTEEIDPEGHATDLFTQWSQDYIREQADEEVPFFLYLAYNAPHTPIQPPEDWLAKVKAREPDMNERRAKLVALIEHMDDGIGQVIQTLKDTGAYENTLIVFTSDNGGQSNVGANNGGLHGGKQDMYEGGIRVPLCAVWTDHIKPGTSSERVAMTMDLFPSITAACAAGFDHSIDGQDFLPTLQAKKQPDDDRTLFWVRREGGPYGGRAYYAARSGPWKLLQNSPFEPLELYNLDEDPGEEKPLRHSHKMYRTLFRALQDHINDAGRIPWQREA